MVAYSFKRRFITPIELGLGILAKGSVDAYPKTQTIRAEGKRRHARPGENVQLYYAMRTKQCRQIGTGKCVDALPITMRIPKDDAFILIKLGDRPEAEATDDFARADGFGCVEDMWLFWREEHPNLPIFKGALIKWEPIR